MIDVAVDISSIYGQRSDQVRAMGGFDKDASAVITLKSRQILFLRQLNRYLALVGIIREENYERQQGLLDFNFNVFKQGVEEVFELGKKRLQS